jgi:hypothetical protein
MACAIRGNNDIKGIKSPGEPGGKELEAKISMFADDYTIFHSIYNVLSNFIIVNIVTMMYPKVFTFSLIHDILLNFGFLLRAVPIEIAFVLL